MAIKVLENEKWAVEISTHGAEMVSAVRKADGRQFVWDAKPDVWKRHAPVLFPIVGKYKENQSRFNGATYTLTQHGFARDMEFTVDCEDENSVTMSVVESEDTLKKYPFKFSLSISYKLNENALSVTWTVNNTNDGDMYFSIGGHPAFVGNGDSLVGAKLVFDTDETSLRYEILTCDGVLGDETDTLSLENGAAVITPDFFSRDALIFENTDCKRVSLEKDGEKIVSVAFDAPVFGIWSAKNSAPFVCFEPWYGRADRASFDGEICDREYGNTLKAGETFSKVHTIYFAQ